jgi:hypothetical protein
MTIEGDHGEDRRTRREWMLDEFRQAQQRRAEAARIGVVELTEPDDKNGDDGGANPDRVVVSVSRP